MSYLFSWNEIPGNDNGKLIEFLKQKYSIDWVTIAKIEKIDDGKAINVSSEKNFLSLRLNEEKTKVKLKIDDGRTDEFIAKKENGKLNTYKMSDIYDRIREENIKKYGTHVNIYGPILLSNLYSDRTHFIFELLQNAEDACERAKNKGISNKFIVKFQLFSDKLEMRHNGIPFDGDDVRGICGLVEGTKSEDVFQIGKFGIGFKSVYAYTKSPEIYSGDKSFCIKNYVQPYSIEPRKHVEDGETLFVIPFDHDKITKENAFSEIGQKLKSLLKLRTLLFLRNIEEITWKVDSLSGKYSRKLEEDNNAKRINLLYEDNENNKIISEKWLKFEKLIYNSNNNQLRVEIAYLLGKDIEGKEQVIPAKDTKLFVFFQTEKETHLKFLTQGPYQTTPTRENIYKIEDNAYNKNLTEKIAILTAESISKIKEMNLLDVSFLNTLPIEPDIFSKENMFKILYDKVKEKFSGDEALLPAHNGRYINAKQALLARGDDLRGLLSSEQLTLLFNKKDAMWLDETITENKTPDLRKYITKELKIEEIDPEAFATKFTESFVKQQSDEWVKRFYAFLIDQKALWREKTYYKDKEGTLRSKPLIRLNDDKHTALFNLKGEPLAYLPSKNESINKLFPIVKQNIAHDSEAKKFLQENLKLREPDNIAGLLNIILPKYKIPVTISKEDNLKHVEWISKTLKTFSKDERRSELIKKLRETPFLYAKNIANSQSEYKKPVEIHTEKKDIEIYFEGNDKIWLLDERYKKIDDDDISTLENVVCNTKIQVTYREDGLDGNVELINRHSCHKKGLNGFDPACEIEGLEYALKCINIERAKIIWNILKEHHKRICGTVESSTNINYNPSTKEDKFSEMGELLCSYSWLPDKDGKFHKPSEILLSQLPEDFDKETMEARYIAEKLKFKTDAEELLKKQLSPEKRKLYDLADELSQKNPNADEILKDLIEKTQDEAQDDISIQEIVAKLKSSVTKDKTWGVGPTPIVPLIIVPLILEDEEKIFKEYGKGLLERLKRVQLTRNMKINVDSKIIDKINPWEFLKQQYNGHCQICDWFLVMSNKGPHFRTFRIIETRGKYPFTYMEWNVLCLCPNCWALMKYGGRDLTNILDKAREVSKNEIAAEEVSDRVERGFFYIINIMVAGKEREIFYTQAHMRKLAAFIGN